MTGSRALAKAVEVLAPLLAPHVVEWLQGDGPEPPELRKLPDLVRLELELERLKRRAAGRGAKS